MISKILFGRWLSPRRRPIDDNGTPTNLMIGELAFDPGQNMFYAGTANAPVSFNTNIIPAPQIHLSRDGNDFPAIAVSYIPTANDSWLQRNPEVWLFAYRKRLKDRAAGFVHPTHVSRIDASKAFYSGASQVGEIPTTYTTEFPFLTAANVPPAPYERVPLAGFNCLEFYWNDATDSRPVLADFPVIKTNDSSTLRCPRLNSMRMRFQFRFAVDNPDTTARAFKLFGPPSPVVYCSPNYLRNYRLSGDPNSSSNPQIIGFRVFM
jgi:hypothetical protein